MPSTQRHADHVASAAAAAGTEPFGPSDVPPVPTDGVERARVGAARDLEEREREVRVAEREHERALLQRERTRRAAEAAAQESADLITELAGMRETGYALVAAVDVAEQAVADADEQAVAARRSATAWAELATALGECAPRPAAQQGGAEAHRLSASLQHAETLLGELQTDPAAGTHVNAAALATWRAQLADGTAPLLPAAAAILEQLERTEAEWAACGAGDVAEDPAVIAARDRVATCRAAVAEVDERGVTGSAGHEARVAIESANNRRTALEAQGRKADPGLIAAAHEEELEALSRVGFDSMLDFRIVMSGAGVGALTAKRRQVVAAQLSDAQTEASRVQDERARHHADLRERLAGLRARAVADLELDPSESLRAQLRRRLGLPEDVRALCEQVGIRETVVAGASDAAAEAALAAAAEMDGCRAERDRVRGICAELEGRSAEAEERMTSTDDERTEAERLANGAEAALAGCRTRAEVARAELAELERTPYLAEDLDRVVQELAASILARRSHDGGGGVATVVLDDPLSDVAVDATTMLLDLLIEGNVEVVVVTSRRELLSALRHRDRRARAVDGRRRAHRFGRRRTPAAVAADTGS